ncbi:hypothetical protein DITRI_Ditri07aG0030000 [Diplodiscus trichospermus]
MDPKWFWMLLTILLLEGRSKGCLKHERIALLQLKSFFDDPNSLSNWVDVKGSDCCQWDRVECNITSRRVTRLSLNFTRQRRIREGRYGYLNASSFHPFDELNSLYLTGNQITGFVDNKGRPRQLMVNLEVLDLSYNHLKNSSFAFISRLSNLKSLNLYSNELQGSIDAKDNENQLKLINLEELDLSCNLFNNSILAQLNGLSNLKSLNLGSNQLKGSINHKELEGLYNLEELNFSYNELQEFSTLKEIGNLRKLKVAKLDGVFISGTVSLLQVVEVFSSVKTLFLRYNRLNKTVSTQGE